jgi:hypothetical protein
MEGHSASLRCLFAPKAQVCCGEGGFERNGDFSPTTERDYIQCRVCREMDLKTVRL